MKKQPFCVILALITILGLSDPGVAADSDAPEKEPPPKDMAEAMDAMSGSLKLLRRLKRDPDRWAKSAAMVAKGSSVVISAMRMIPRKIQDLPDGPAKLKALADSRRLMGLTLAGYGRLELAFLAESEEQVEEALDFLKEIKAESHEKYNRGE
ncbi:MAG TPA: hypothetical protein DCQ96_14115 [Verrucomicrobiales bacterium]|nr:hypothetical protein [Verrucomicrobiales bacterium]